MKNLIRSAAVAATVLAAAPTANASTYDVNFGFTFAGEAETVTGTIVTNCDNCFLFPIPSQPSRITSFSFSWTGFLIGTLGSGSSQSSNKSADPVLDAVGGGIFFSSAGNGLGTNAIFSDTAGNQIIFGPSLDCDLTACITVESNFGAGGVAFAAVTTPFTIATEEFATPLPATFLLFASGLGVLGRLGWRSKKKAAALSA